MKGMVHLWAVDIPEALFKRGCQAIPDIITPGTRVGNAVHDRNKLKRLGECSGYLATGRVRFAGRRMWNRKDKGEKQPCDKIPASRIAILCDHILNFDGTNNSDAVDSVSQFILFYADRLKSRADTEPVKVKVAEKRRSPFYAAFQRQIKKALDAYEEKPVAAEEQRFMSSKYGQPRSEPWVNN